MIDFLSLITFSLGLSLDDFALAFALCLLLQDKSKNEQMKYATKMAVAFSVSTVLLPLITWLFSLLLLSKIEQFGNWIILIVFCSVGSWIIKEAFEVQSEEEKENQEKKQTLGTKTSSFLGLILIGIASSVDEGATGFAFPFLDLPIVLILIAVIIGNSIVVFMASFVVQYKKQWNQKNTVIISGLLLIFLGVFKWLQFTFFNIFYTNGN